MSMDQAATQSPGGNGAPAGSGATAAQFAERLLADTVTTMEMLSVQLGIQLGLYRALADGPADPRQLAERADIHPRYAREWLEQQAVAGLLRAEGGDPDPYRRIFALPDGHRETLLDADSPNFLGTMPGFAVSFANALSSVATAYRGGGGVPYQAYGELARHGIAGMNRPMFRTELAGWLAALPDLQPWLRGENGPVRVLDLGCGAGASSIALAQQLPAAQVHGVDLDHASVAEAESAASRHGVADRVSFTETDAAALTGPERYQLVCMFEVLHDLADPVATLRAAHRLLVPGGTILIGDERVADQFSPPGDLVERLNYGFSVLHCLPSTRAEGSAVEAGTVLRPGLVHEYATKAGLTCTELPIESDLWRFYRLDPI